jgi:hypothetical protein
VLVNGVKLPQVARGGESSDSWVSIEGDDSDPCNYDQFALHFSALPSAWLTPLTEIRVSDRDTAFEADVENLFVGPTLAFPAGTAPELHPGATVTLSVTPAESELVDKSASLTFIPDGSDAMGPTFAVSTGDSSLSLDDHSVTFLVPDVEPAHGTLLFEVQALYSEMSTCSGFLECDVPAGDLYAFYASAPLVAVAVP